MRPPSTGCFVLPAQRTVRDDIVPVLLCFVGFRPESIYDDAENVEKYASSSFDVNVEVTELMGAEIYLYLSIGETNLTARVAPTSTAHSGDKIKIAFDADKLHIFDKDTERCICH